MNEFICGAKVAPKVVILFISGIFWVGLHYGTALFAGTQFFRIVKVAVVWQEILLYIVQLKIHLIQFVVAIIAVPQQPVGEAAAGTFALYHQAD